MLRTGFRFGVLTIALLAAIPAMAASATENVATHVTSKSAEAPHTAVTTSIMATSATTLTPGAAAAPSSKTETVTAPVTATTSTTSATTTKTTATETTAPAKPAEKAVESTPAAPAATEVKPSSPLKPAQPGMALVRIIDGSSSSVDVKVNGKSYSGTAGTVGHYYNVPQGPAEVAEGGSKTSANFAPGGFYSILVGKNKLEVREEPRNVESKVQFVLINLSDTKGVSIKTSAGAASDVGPVEPGALATAQMNPIKVTLGVYDGSGNLIATLNGLDLEKGMGYAVLVYTGRDGKPAVSYGKAGGA